MDHSVGGGNIRRDHISVIHLHLAVGLLQRQRESAGHRVLDLVEPHAGREQRTLDQMFRHQLLGQVLVRHQVGQLLGRHFGERFVGGREHGVRFDACKKGTQINPRSLLNIFYYRDVSL